MYYEPQDADFDARVRASFAEQNMMHTMGMSIGALGPGTIDVVFDHDERFTQQHGFAHGGFIATALDTACGFAALTLMIPEAAVLTVEYKINYLRPASGATYRASAHVVKAGRTLTTCEATVTADDSDKPISTMTATLMTLLDTGIKD